LTCVHMRQVMIHMFKYPRSRYHVEMIIAKICTNFFGEMGKERQERRKMGDGERVGGEGDAGGTREGVVPRRD